ncbi:hypothetical protein D3C75_1094550 [compost metagenome]
MTPAYSRPADIASQKKVTVSAAAASLMPSLAIKMAGMKFTRLISVPTYRKKKTIKSPSRTHCLPL